MTPMVVTGMALNTALGRDLKSIFESIDAKASNFKPISVYCSAGSHLRVAAECSDIDVKILPDRKMQKVLRRKDLIAVTTAVAAFKNAQCSETISGDRIGVFTGVGCNHIGDLVPWFEAVKTSVDQGKGEVDSVKFGQLVSSTVNPIAVLQSLMNNALAYTTIALNARGANSNFMQFNTSGFRAVAEGVRALADGSIDVAVVGAAAAPVEPFQAVESWVHGRLAEVDPSETDTRLVVRPWDQQARGTILGEGAAFLVLETQEHARRREAAILGRILGSGFASDPGFQPGKGLMRAVGQALEKAAVPGEDIALVVGEGNGDRIHDEQELRILAAIFEVWGIDAPVWTSRAAFGETEEAASMIDLVVNLYGYANGKMPAAPGLELPLLEGLRFATSETSLTRKPILMTARSKFGDCAALVIGPS